MERKYGLAVSEEFHQLESKMGLFIFLIKEAKVYTPQKLDSTQNFLKT